MCVCVRFSESWSMSHMFESCHTCTGVVSRIWLSHVTLWRRCVSKKRSRSSVLHWDTRVNESCHTYKQVVSRGSMSHKSLICVIFRWMIHRCVLHDSCICVTWLIYICDMTHAYVWHDSSICATWLMINVCDILILFFAQWLIRESCHTY